MVGCYVNIINPSSMYQLGT